MRDLPGALESDPSRILVVIPALNEERHIEACIASLTPARDRNGPLFVVADGGSRDRTVALVERMAADRPWLRLISNPDRLQAAAVNRAVAAYGSGKDILVRCDAHAVYPPGYVLDVARSLRAQGAASLVVPMDSVGTTAFGRASAWAANRPFGTGGAAHRGGRRSGWVDHGHHAGIDLDWFRRIGGYDPSFSHNEDAEFDHRLREAGGTIWLDADIRLDYVMRPTLGSLARQYWNYGKGRARTILKHAMRPRLRQLAPVLNLLGMAAAVLLSPWQPLLLIWPLAYLLLLALISVAGAVGLRSLAGLWVGPGLLAMHNAWAAGFLAQMIRHVSGGRQRWRAL